MSRESRSLRGWVKRDRIDRGEGGPGELTSAEREELTRLRRQNAEQQKTIEILKSRGLLGQRQRPVTEVYQFIAAGQAVYPVTLLCRVLGMVRPSFYAWLEAEQDRRARERADEASEPATSTPTAPAPDQGHLRLPPQGTAASAHQHHARHPRPMWN